MPTMFKNLYDVQSAPMLDGPHHLKFQPLYIIKTRYNEAEGLARITLLYPLLRYFYYCMYRTMNLYKDFKGNFTYFVISIILLHPISL